MSGSLNSKPARAEPGFGQKPAAQEAWQNLGPSGKVKGLGHWASGLRPSLGFLPQLSTAGSILCHE